MYKAGLLVTLLVGVAILASCANTPAADQAEAREAALAAFRVTGMTCDGCAVGVRMAVERLDGVQKAEVSYEKGQALVSYDPLKVNPKKIAAAIENLGYQAELRQDEKAK